MTAFYFAVPMKQIRIPLKQTILSLLIASTVLSSCHKENITVPVEACTPQTENPTGRSYENGEIVSVNYSKKNCGIIPLSTRNYWVYEDSVFNDGVFVKVKMDTLQFSKTYQSVTDQLIWWETNINIGLPDLIYANDSAIFLAEYRLFATDPIRDAKKEYGLFPGDSVKYFTSFEDNAAFGRSVKMQENIYTPAGQFGDCLLFEKKAPFSRKDQVYLKPGLGVVKYISERAPIGMPVLKIQQISTLVSYHIE